MKKNTKIASILSVGVLSASLSFGQERLCATDEMVTKSLQEHPELMADYLAEQARLEAEDKILYPQGYPDQNGRPPAYTIPIVFHIIHLEGPENISDAQVNDEVRILNEDFNKTNSDISTVVSAFQGITGKAEFTFVLAKKDPNGNCTNGIIRHYSSETNVGDNGTMSQFIWPRNKYLNVFVVNDISSGAAGYTYLPGTTGSSTDGIIIKHSYIGSIGTGNSTRSRALTHEIGHWFNLPHTWGGTNTPAQPNNCNYDDGVSDTPNTIGWQSCNLSGTSCGSLDNVQNFMEYSYCSKMFTAGQASRMRSAATSSTASRNNLWSSSNLSATGVSTPAVLCKADFETTGNTTTVCKGGTLTFKDLSWNGTPSTYSWSFTGGTPSTSSAASPTITYNTPGQYAVSLTVSNSSGTVSATKTAYVTVFDAPGVQGSPFYSEGFEGSSMPNNFYIVNANSGSATWTQATVGATGSKSARIINSASYTGHTDELIGPSIDMTSVGSSPNMTFKVAHAQKTSTSNDNLIVYVSTNCGQTWILRMSLKGANLATAGVQSGSFTPTAADWVTKTINLSGYATSTNLLFKFVFISDGGNNVYVDDINIAGTVSGIGIDEQIANSLNLNVYPNPIESNSIISFSLIEKQNVEIKITDITGRVVSTIHSGSLNAGDYQYPLANNANLNAGVYLVNFTVNNQLFTKKLIIK